MDTPLDLFELQQRSAELAFTNPYVSGALSDIVREVVGTRPLPVRVAGFDYEKTKQINEAWRDFWEGNMSDKSRRRNVELERQALHDTLVYGDCVVVYDNEATEHFSGQQITDAAGYMKRRMGGRYNQHWLGVALNEYNAAVTIFARRVQHLGGINSTPPPIVEIDAAGALYVTLPNRGLAAPRSWPALTAILAAAFTIQTWDKGLALSIDLLDRLPAVLKNTMPESDIFNEMMSRMGGVDDTGGYDGEGDIDEIEGSETRNWNPNNDARPVTDIADGRDIITLPQGWDIQILNPNSLPSGAFTNYRGEILTMIAAGMGLSLSSVIKNAGITGSYSSARMDKLSDNAVFDAMREWWMREYRTPLFLRWLKMNAQKLGISMKAAEKAKVKWLPEPTKHIDPAKQMAAEMVKMRLGLVDPLELVEQYTGQFPEKIAESRKAFEALFGVNITDITTPNAPNSAGGDGDSEAPSPKKDDE